MRHIHKCLNLSEQIFFTTVTCSPHVTLVPLRANNNQHNPTGGLVWRISFGTIIIWKISVPNFWLTQSYSDQIQPVHPFVAFLLTSNHRAHVGWILEYSDTY